MSQEGLLLITKPDFVEEACKGWPRNEEGTPTPDARRVDDVLEIMARAKPVSHEMAMHGSDRGIGRTVLFVGWNPEPENDDEVVYNLRGDPCYVYELSDSDFDETLGKLDGWGRYGTSANRNREGLKVYWVVFSY